MARRNQMARVRWRKKMRNRCRKSIRCLLCGLTWKWLVSCALTCNEKSVILDFPGNSLLSSWFLLVIVLKFLNLCSSSVIFFGIYHVLLMNDLSSCGKICFCSAKWIEATRWIILIVKGSNKKYIIWKKIDKEDI